MTVEELKVILELETKGFKNQVESAKKSLGDVEKQATSLKDRLRGIFNRMSDPVKKASQEVASEANKAQSTIQQSAEASAKGFGKLGQAVAQARDVMRTLRAVGLQSRVDAGLIEPTEQAAKYQQEINDCTEALNILHEAMQTMDPEGDSYKALEQEAAGYEARVDELTQKIKSMPTFGVGGLFQDTGKISNIKTLKAEFEGLKSVISGFAGEARTAFREAFSATPIGKFAKVAGSGLTTVKRFIIGAMNDLGRLGKGILKAGSHFLNFARKAKGAGSSVLGFIKKALGVGAIIALFKKMKSLAQEGMGNLGQYSNRTAKDLATLKGALTQVKNGLAVAFAPILTVVAPLIQTLVNYITAACNALAMFFGALTGQSTVTIATSGFGDIAAGAAGAADATNAANGAAQEYQRTLMGFDQINKLDDNKSSGGGGGGAGGAGGGAGFGTAEVANVYSEWAEKIKEAWDKADFYSLGQSVGEKIRDGLESINWDSIKAVGEKIAKSIATGLNGFLETPGLFTAVGKTIAESLNTVFNTANTFATTFNWKALGQAIGDSINSFFANFDFVMAAKTISNIAKGLFDSIISAVKRIDWGQIGRQLAEFIANIDWIGLIGKAIELAGMVIKGVADFTINFIKTLASRILEWLYGLIKGHNDAVLNVKLNGKEDQSFTKTKADYEAMRDKPTTVTTKGHEHSTFINAQKDFNGMASKTATVTLKATGVLDAGTKAIRELVNAKSSKNFTFSAVGGVITMIPKAATMANGGIFQNGTWKPITAAANGGNFNTGQVFLAREAGPELVGSIGGHTAVMNNSQIVSSVSAGVYKAVLSAMSQQNGNTPITVTLEGDAQGLFRMVRAEARNYTNATGLSAFPV